MVKYFAWSGSSSAGFTMDGGRRDKYLHSVGHMVTNLASIYSDSSSVYISHSYDCFWLDFK
ncbi:hypothetical protein LINGRAHAP2_LOCUS14733 [Linum grandiflorum]